MELPTVILGWRYLLLMAFPPAFDAFIFHLLDVLTDAAAEYLNCPMISIARIREPVSASP